MKENLTSTWEWSHSAKTKILGLHQADRGNHVTFFDESGGVYVLDPKGKLMLDMAFPRPVFASRIVHNGSRIYILDRNGVLHGFSTRGERLWKVPVGEHAVCMDARGEGQAIAVACRNGLVSLFNGHGKKLRSLYLAHPVEFVKFSYETGFLVAANSSGLLSLMDRQFRFKWKLNMQTQCGGVDVDQNASMILLPAFSEGAYAFSKEREAIGAYEIGKAIFSSALCQQGQRILAVSRDGHLHAIRRDGSLAYSFAIQKDVKALDLNFDGDTCALIVGGNEIRNLKLYDSGKSTPLPLKAKQPKKSVVQSTTWSADIPGGGNAQVRLTANGAYAVALSEKNVLAVWDDLGHLVWRDQLDPGYEFRLQVARAANTIFVSHDQGGVYYTCPKGRVNQYDTSVRCAAVHDAGLHFAIASNDQNLALYDKSGACVWQQKVHFSIEDLAINSKGNAVFVASKDGKLHAFRQSGKLGWEKKFSSKEQNMVLGDFVAHQDFRNVYAHPRAQDGFYFKDRVIAKATRFVLDRYGITLGDPTGHIFRISTKGKVVWEHQVPGPVSFLKNLREHTLVRIAKGTDYLFDRSGKLLSSCEPISGLRQFVTNNQHDILVLQSEGERLRCENALTQEVLWTHQAPGLICQFHVEICGRNMVYIAEQKVFGLSLVPGEESDENRVAFLEF